MDQQLLVVKVKFSIMIPCKLKEAIPSFCASDARGVSTYEALFAPQPKDTEGT